MSLKLGVLGLLFTAHLSMASGLDEITNTFGLRDESLYPEQEQPSRYHRVQMQPRFPQPPYPVNPAPETANNNFLKNGIMQLTQEIQSMLMTTDAADAELAKAQEYLMRAKNLMVSYLAPGACAVLFDGDGFTGMRFDIYPGYEKFIYNLSWYGFNDRAKSFKLKPGCRMGLWMDKNSGGAVQYYTTSSERIPAPLYSQATTVKCGCNNEVF